MLKRKSPPTVLLRPLTTVSSGSIFTQNLVNDRGEYRYLWLREQLLFKTEEAAGRGIWGMEEKMFSMQKICPDPNW